jgi:phenylacetate-CoA ligase
MTIWLRRQAAQNSELRRQLFGDDPRLPMVFQYNPLDYMIEAIDSELVITVSRLCMLSPRIRYNIHDAGGGHSYTDVVAICRDFGLDPGTVETPYGRPAFRLPILWVHGRSDATISYMGANIYPEDVEQALFADLPLGDRLMGFCLELRDIGDGGVRPCVHVEVSSREGDESNTIAALRRAVVGRLELSSRDFKNAVEENPSAAEIIIELHNSGEGPFAENNRRIKRRYIVPRG